MSKIHIPLDKGLFAIIDEADYDIVSLHKWYARKNNRNTYATSCNNKRLHMHRLIMGVSNSKIYVDHKNHNGLDNRKDNLRIVTHSQNMCNKRSYTNSTSTYKGVHWNNGKSLWTTQIRIPKGKTIHVGHFKDENEAAAAYNIKAIELHGEFACLNNIDDKSISDLVPRNPQ